MLTLGWHGGYSSANDPLGLFTFGRDGIAHDSAAALLHNGRIVAAIEEERLSRVKHTTAFPARAIRFCLKQAGVDLAEVDAIATDAREEFLDRRALRRALRDPNARSTTGRELIAGLFEREFGVRVERKLHFCSHHLAHIHASWHACGFEEALAVCLDGIGEEFSGLIARCDGDGVRPLRHLPVQQSLGLFYVSCIEVLGYQLFDEYKVMGLAPYGDPAVFRPLFAQLYKLLPEGRFALLPEEQRVALLRGSGLSMLRRKGDEFQQVHKDFAAAVQEALEHIALHLIEHLQRATGARSLCLSGGVAHNCSMNGRLLRSGLFEQIYVQPAAHDAGNALGAALAVQAEPRAAHTSVMPHVYLGRDIGDDEEIREQLERWQPLITARRADDIAHTTAHLLAQGAVIAWVQGRSEFGPRALGNRSILADPRPAANKRIINAMVKKREGYRPFAPSVLKERLHSYFDVPPHVSALPFMTMAVPVRLEKRSQLGAITHVDGTARVQTVERDQNPRYYALIEAFEKLTDVPIVLNTSLNNDVEPIVDSVEDAIVTFLTTGLTHLVVGQWLIEKIDALTEQPEFSNLVPALTEDRDLVWRAGPMGELTASVHPPRSMPLGLKPLPISRHLAQMLSSGGVSIAEYCGAAGIEPLQMVAEIFEAWQRRVLTLRPRCRSES